MQEAFIDETLGCGAPLSYKAQKETFQDIIEKVSEIDKNIFYISATRALHKLSVVSVDKGNDFIKKYKESL